MSIQYYLVDRRFGRRYDVGSHRYVYNRALRVALHMAPPPPEELFCLACAASVEEAVRGSPEAFVDPDPWLWAFHSARHAANIYDFCEQAYWDVALVNDCDDSLSDDDYAIAETHTIYRSRLTPTPPSYE